MATSRKKQLKKRNKLNGCARMERVDKAWDKMSRMWAELGVTI